MDIQFSFNPNAPIKWELSDSEFTGVIQIGDFIESFIADTSIWSEKDYIRQWIDGTKRITKRSAEKSCLITSISDPKTLDYSDIWKMYLEGNVVIFQMQMILPDRKISPTNYQDIYDTIDDRFDEEDDPDERPSEWFTTIDALTDFSIHLESTFSKME